MSPPVGSNGACGHMNRALLLVDAIKSDVTAYGRSGGIAVDVCEGGATRERILSNDYHGVGDGYGGERGAKPERRVPNARD